MEDLDALVAARATARWHGDYPLADALRQRILAAVSSNNELPYKIRLQDLPRSQGGGSQWSLRQVGLPTTTTTTTVPPASAARHNSSSSTVLQLAHAALGLAVSACADGERGRGLDDSQQQQQQQRQVLVDQATHQLRHWDQCRDRALQRHSGDGDDVMTNTADVVSLVDTKLRALLASTKNEKNANSNDLYYDDAYAGWSAVETNLRGRKAADAAFWLAVAGVQDTELFDLLTRVCVKELERLGCRARDVYPMVERLAAAGVRPPPQHPENNNNNTQHSSSRLEAVARQCLQSKDEEPQRDGSTLRLLDLHSDRAALLLWRFSARQRKQKAFLRTAARHWEASSVSSLSPRSCTKWQDTEEEQLTNEQHHNQNSDSSDAGWNWELMFDDPTRPLVCDLGCGMGVSLLGLASLEAATVGGNHSDFYYGWSDCNFVGVDLSALSINYAKSIAARWNIDGKLAFVVDTAESLLEHVKTYPGPVKRVLIQFPTPYRLPDGTNGANTTTTTTTTKEKVGNSQLPKSVEDGFMVTPRLLRQSADVLRPANGELLLQSNCEDVAVWMRSTACQNAGFLPLSSEDHPASCSVTEIAGNPTQRTLNWISIGGERATGAGWIDKPILPPKGRTETEIACTINSKPVHRCILRSSPIPFPMNRTVIELFSPC